MVWSELWSLFTVFGGFSQRLDKMTKWLLIVAAVLKFLKDLIVCCTNLSFLSLSGISWMSWSTSSKSSLNICKQKLTRLFLSNKVESKELIICQNQGLSTRSKSCKNFFYFPLQVDQPQNLRSSSFRHRCKALECFVLCLEQWSHHRPHHLDHHDHRLRRRRSILRTVIIIERFNLLMRLFLLKETVRLNGLFGPEEEWRRKIRTGWKISRTWSKNCSDASTLVNCFPKIFSSWPRAPDTAHSSPIASTRS